MKLPILFLILSFFVIGDSYSSTVYEREETPITYADGSGCAGGASSSRRIIAYAGYEVTEDDGWWFYQLLCAGYQPITIYDCITE